MSPTCLFYRAVDHRTLAAHYVEPFERYRTAYLAWHHLEHHPNRAAMLGRDRNARLYETLLARMDKRHIASLDVLSLAPSPEIPLQLLRNRLDMMERQFRAALQALEDELARHRHTLELV